MQTCSRDTLRCVHAVHSICSKFCSVTVIEICVWYRRPLICVWAVRGNTVEVETVSSYL